MPEQDPPIQMIAISESLEEQHWLKIAGDKPGYVTRYKAVYAEISCLQCPNSDYSLELTWYVKVLPSDWIGPKEEFPKDFPIELLKRLGLFRIDRLLEDAEMILGPVSARRFRKALRQASEYIPTCSGIEEVV
jgi:hypothetical protein